MNICTSFTGSSGTFFWVFFLLRTFTNLLYQPNSLSFTYYSVFFFLDILCLSFYTSSTGQWTIKEWTKNYFHQPQPPREETKRPSSELIKHPFPCPPGLCPARQVVSGSRTLLPLCRTAHSVLFSLFQCRLRQALPRSVTISFIIEMPRRKSCAVGVKLL